MLKIVHGWRFAMVLLGTSTLIFGCARDGKDEGEVGSGPKTGAVVIKHAGYRAEELFDAVKRGNAGEVAELVEDGADTSAKDDVGTTPLMLAIVNNKRNVVRLLVDKVELEERDDSGNTALIIASMSGGCDALDVNDPLTLVDPYEERVPCDQSGRPADTVEALLEAGSDVNARNDSGNTALMVATEEKKMEILLRHGADIDAADREGRTALMTAALECRGDRVRYLLKKGASRSPKDSEGRTARDLVQAFRARTRARINEISDSHDWNEVREQLELKEKLGCIEESQAIMSL